MVEIGRVSFSFALSKIYSVEDRQASYPSGNTHPIFKILSPVDTREATPGQSHPSRVESLPTVSPRCRRGRA